MRDVNRGRRVRIGAVAVCALLAACATGDLRNGEADPPDETSARSTTAATATTAPTDSTAPSTTLADATTTTALPTTTAAPTTTLPADPWQLATVVGLDNPPPYVIGDLLTGPGGLLIVGTSAQDGPPFVALSRDGGTTWQKAVGDDSPDVVQRLVPLDDGTQWTLLVSSMFAADGTGTVARWVPDAAGAFTVETPALAGLDFDAVVSQDDAPRDLTYSYSGPRHAVRLADGTYVAAGSGQWGRYLDSLDSTPYVASSPDGANWVVAPGPQSEQLTEESLLQVFDTPTGPVIAQDIIDNGTYVLRLQRAGDTFETLFEQPREAGSSNASVEVIPSASGVVLLYRALGSTIGSRITQLITSPDGTSWTAAPLTIAEYPDLGVVDMVPFGNGYALLGYATQDGATTRTPLLLTGNPGTWERQDVARFAEVSPLAMAPTGDGGLLILARDANGASVLLTRGADGG